MGTRPSDTPKSTAVTDGPDAAREKAVKEAARKKERFAAPSTKTAKAEAVAAPATVTAVSVATVNAMLEEAGKTEFASWKQEFGKKYASGAEEEKAFANFAANARLSKTMNAILKQPATKLSERSDQPLPTRSGATAPPKTSGSDDAARQKAEEAAKMLQAKALEEAKNIEASPPETSSSSVMTKVWLSVERGSKSAPPAPRGFAKRFPRTTRFFRSVFGRGASP